jgi:hypothetical protein
METRKSLLCILRGILFEILNHLSMVQVGAANTTISVYALVMVF